tara:strand:+ start:3110 stop:3880 length:771 start_codon:yes stop_codon:yes gene_type:complete
MVNGDVKFPPEPPHDKKCTIEENTTILDEKEFDMDSQRLAYLRSGTKAKNPLLDFTELDYTEGIEMSVPGTTFVSELGFELPPKTLRAGESLAAAFDLNGQVSKAIRRFGDKTLRGDIMDPNTKIKFEQYPKATGNQGFTYSDGTTQSLSSKSVGVYANARYLKIEYLNVDRSMMCFFDVKVRHTIQFIDLDFTAASLDFWGSAEIGFQWNTDYTLLKLSALGRGNAGFGLVEGEGFSSDGGSSSITFLIDFTLNF